MNTKTFAALAIALSGVSGLNAHASGIKLYPTGPAKDSSFVRFVNASVEGELEVKAAGTNVTLKLSTDSRASAYMPIAAGSTIEGELKQGNNAQKIRLPIQPGEFLTVLGLQTSKGFHALEVREEGDGFTAVRASIAFYSLNDQCKAAAVQVAGRSVFLFEHVEVGKWLRRQINPVPLSVQLSCDGESVGKPLDLGLLQAGERYSLFLVPGDPGKSFFQIKDNVVN